MLFLKIFQWHELVGDRALIPKSCLLASYLKVTGSLCHPLNIEQVYGCILICEVFQRSWNIHFMIILSWYWQTVRAKASGSTYFFFWQDSTWQNSWGIYSRFWILLRVQWIFLSCVGEYKSPCKFWYVKGDQWVEECMLTIVTQIISWWK